MNYELNLKLSPRLNLFKAINALNDKNYGLARFVVRGIIDKPDDSCVINVDLLQNGRSDETDYVSFTFNRIQINSIFSSVIAQGLNNLLPSVIMENGAAAPQKVSQEVKRRFGFYLDDYYYSYSSNGDVVTVTALDNNPIYKGSVQFNASGYRKVTGELLTFVNTYENYLPIVMVKPLSILQRDENADINVGNVSVGGEVEIPEGACVLRVNDKLAIVKDRENFITVLGGNKVTMGEDAPINPKLNDVWIEV